MPAQPTRNADLVGVVGCSNELDDRGDYHGAVKLLVDAIAGFCPTPGELAEVARRLKLPVPENFDGLLREMIRRYYRDDSFLTALQVTVKVLSPDAVYGDPATAFHPDHHPDRLDPALSP